MHLSFAASRWLWSDGQYVKSMGWGEFFQLVLEHFGKDQHEVLLRQMLHIRQTAGVQEYADRFTKMVISCWLTARTRTLCSMP